MNSRNLGPLHRPEGGVKQALVMLEKGKILFCFYKIRVTVSSELIR